MSQACSLTFPYQQMVWRIENPSDLLNIQAWLVARLAGKIFNKDDLRRPGDPSHLRDGRPIGFASPAFAGFAFVGT
jgi:hypothetical protein